MATILTIAQINRIIDEQISASSHNSTAVGVLQGLKSCFASLPRSGPPAPPAAAAGSPAGEGAPQPTFPGVAGPLPITPMPNQIGDTLDGITSALASISQRVAALEISSHNAAAGGGEDMPPTEIGDPPVIPGPAGVRRKVANAEHGCEDSTDF